MNVISKRLTNLLKEHNCNIRIDYSSRHMYGIKCFGIEFKTNLWNFVENELSIICDKITNLTIIEMQSISDNTELKNKLEKDINTLDYMLNIDNTQFDNLGLKYILYYPNMKIEK